SVEPRVFALLAVAMGLPYVVVGPLAGVLVDRAPLRSVMVAANFGKAAVTASFVLAGRWEILLLLVFLRNSIDAFYAPAKQAALKALAAQEDLGGANALSLAVNQMSKIAGPAVGGVLLATMAASGVFLFNACVATLAGLLTLRLVHLPGAPMDAAHPGLFASLGEVRRMVVERPRLAAALGLMAAGFWAMFLYDSLIAPLVAGLGFNETELGLILAAVGAGGVLGALGSGRGAARRPFAVVAGAGALGALLIIGLGFAERLGLVLPLAGILTGGFVIGLVSAAILVPLRTVMQAETPPDRMARVASVSEAANTMALLAAPFAGAALADALGLGAAFIAGGALALVNALFAFRRARRDARGGCLNHFRLPPPAALCRQVSIAGREKCRTAIRRPWFRPRGSLII
ncbi:MAG TPA: hypothetical protein DIU07_02625, partial [Rhodobacteraceae bacterium]|nr:hypothetical protein [Paracoccaceae bacterium]